MALIRCAHIDPNGVYLGMVEVEEEALTARHLPQIASCDLAPLEYRWAPDADPKNPYGGRFEPLTKHRRPKAGGAVPSLEQLVYSLLKALEAQGIALPADAAPWVASFEKSLDHQDGAR